MVICSIKRVKCVAHCICYLDFLRFKPFTLYDALTHVCKYLFLHWKKYIKIWIWSRTVNIPDNLTHALWFLHLNFKLLPSFTCILHVTNGKLLGTFSMIKSSFMCIKFCMHLKTWAFHLFIIRENSKILWLKII